MNTSNEPLRLSELQPYGGMFNLGRKPGIFHAETPDDQEVLVCESYIPYPDSIGAPLSEILLGRTEAINPDGTKFDGLVLELPGDYLPLAGVLNESFSVISPRSEDFLMGVFMEVGAGLKRACAAGQGTPAELSYRKIIIQRDIPTFNILPSIDWLPDGNQETLENLGDIMLAECMRAAATEARAIKLAELFEGFRRGIRTEE